MLRFLGLFMVFVTLIFNLHPALADNDVKIYFKASVAEPNLGNFQVFFRFFNSGGNFETSSFYKENGRTGYQYFDVKYVYENGKLDNDFYFFGKLTSNDGSGTILGFLPLTFVKVIGRGVDKKRVRMERGEIDLGRIPIALFGKDTIKLDATSCWRNKKKELSGLAARQSYPFAHFSKFTRDNTTITLFAIKDLVKYRFINTCPTWNRLRGILRDDLAGILDKLSPEEIGRILQHLDSLYSLTSLEEDWREVPKIYNDVLEKTLRLIGETKISGRPIGEIIFEKHQELVRNQLNRIFWRLDNILMAYMEQERYLQCMHLFSQISEGIETSEHVNNIVKNNEAVDETIYRLFQISTECAARFSDSNDIGKIVKKVSGEKLGKDYIHRYVMLYDKLDGLQGKLFPKNIWKTRNPRAVKEISKYWESFYCYLHGCE